MDSVNDSTILEVTALVPKPVVISCEPIKNIAGIETCLLNPPNWIEQVIPLKKRSGFVKKNHPADCHINKDDFNSRKHTDSRIVPKTLVCHDYRGGHLTDSFVPLNSNDERKLAKEGYSFYNWSQIDLFVYFSHHFVTIPPLSWINVAHKNGVKILGTIITEFTSGAKICDEHIFSNRDSMKEFAYNLTQILEMFGFDGWLLNIENKVTNPAILKEFVGILTEQTHENNKEHIILWYDSVTEDGQLDWQDQLNEKNKCYFDLCDGIFLNYCWDEKKLANTVEVAGDRKLDVFVGVDVFGRNMFGGGMFNTFKAVELISKYELSLAIFAPGWTYETMEKNPEETAFSRFLTRNDTLWLSLWSYLYTHPITDFFSTSFHLGIDPNVYSLFVQEQQLSRILYPDEPNTIPDFKTIFSLDNTCDCLKRCHVGSANVCLISNERLKYSNPNVIHNLFACEIKINSKLGVYVRTKRVNSSDLTTLNIVLLTALPTGDVKEIVLLSQRKDKTIKNASLLEINPLEKSQIEKNKEFNDISIKYPNTEILLFYQFETTLSQLLEIGGVLVNGDSILLLGFGIFPIKEE